MRQDDEYPLPKGTPRKKKKIPKATQKKNNKIKTYNRGPHSYSTNNCKR